MCASRDPDGPWRNCVPPRRQRWPITKRWRSTPEPGNATRRFHAAGEKAMGRFARSWALVKASAAVLRSDRKLMVFPLLSTIAALLVVASFALPLAYGGALRDLEGNGAPAWAWPLAF